MLRKVLTRFAILNCMKQVHYTNEIFVVLIFRIIGMCDVENGVSQSGSSVDRSACRGGACDHCSGTIYELFFLFSLRYSTLLPLFISIDMYFCLA